MKLLSNPFGRPFALITLLLAAGAAQAHTGHGTSGLSEGPAHPMGFDHLLAPHVELVDGGTQGLYLLPNVQSATRLLIFDAIDYGLTPGTLKLIEDDEVPKFMGAKKMSLHQTGFQEVLCLAQLTGQYPQRVLLIGCQPEELDDYGGSLRPIVKQTLATALAHGLERLSAWGAAPQRRTHALSEDESLGGSAILTLDRYESERPSAAQACRLGDDRFIPKVA